MNDQSEGGYWLTHVPHMIFIMHMRSPTLHTPESCSADTYFKTLCSFGLAR